MTIRMPQMKFFARHGVLDQERTVGADFLVSLVLHIDDEQARPALFGDDLSGTVNYAEVYAAVARLMQEPCALLEHVAANVARTLIRSFRLLRQVDVSVTKCTPPISGYQGAGVSVDFSLRRQLVAWDFDGTIADTSRGIVRTMTATFQKLNIALPTEQEICATIGLPLTKSIALLTGLSEGSEEVNQAVEVYREIFEEIGNKGITLFPTVKDELQRQHDEGVFVAIATSRGHESVDGLCTMLGIRQFIDEIVACEDVSVHKPAPQPVLRLCELTNVRPEDTTVIGDTTYDILMGRNAHAATCLGVGWGNHSAQMLLEAGADRVVEAFGCPAR